MDQSQQFSLTKADLKKIGKGALIAVAGAVLTYATQTIGHVDFGTWTPIAVTVSSIVINAAQKFLAGESVK